MSSIETNNGCPNSSPDRFCLSIVSDYIAANWADFSDYAKHYEVDPEDLYQKISGDANTQNECVDGKRTFDYDQNQRLIAT
ncbi:hypothetical protein [Methylotuvimicrobium sp. KM1]|uniref:hypothetical protein n=1 Tax=Methylotuvimicrobium sp. KM1 TaxID=3377707 RepID=UPI00384FED14